MTVRNNLRPRTNSRLVQTPAPTFTPASKTPGAVDARALRSHLDPMPDIWGSTNELADVAASLREEVQLHLARKLGDAHIAFSDQDGWTGRSKEPGPPVDVLVVPPEGERRFAYVCTFGSSLRKLTDANPNGRMEFALAVPQKGDPKTDLASLNLAANTVRQFAKLVHIQDIRVKAGETVQFSKHPKPVFENAKQIAFAFMAPRLPDDGFSRLKLDEKDAITFWSPVPIYREELEAGAAHGPARRHSTPRHAGWPARCWRRGSCLPPVHGRRA
jgi:hypothetical protein